MDPVDLFFSGIRSAFSMSTVAGWYVLYGQPGDRGTIVNVIVAAIILGCLVLGRESLRGGAAQKGDATDGAARSC